MGVRPGESEGAGRLRRGVELFAGRGEGRPGRQAAQIRGRGWGGLSALPPLPGTSVQAALRARALFTLLPPCPVAALGPAAAVEIYTSRVLEAVNGTDVRLKCTFSSFAPVGDALTVTWNFRPQDGGSEQFVSRCASFSQGPCVGKTRRSVSPGPSCVCVFFYF